MDFDSLIERKRERFRQLARAIADPRLFDDRKRASEAMREHGSIKQLLTRRVSNCLMLPCSRMASLARLRSSNRRGSAIARASCRKRSRLRSIRESKSISVAALYERRKNATPKA